MKREKVTDQFADEVVGGSIVFTTDHTTCGLNCNNQCKVLDYDAAIQYIRENYQTMGEKDMLRNMVAMGYIVRL